MRLLVRHAHAGDKRHWTGPDVERPLSVRGWRQAQGLLDVLTDVRVERLLTSPSLRCRQTLLPLAVALDLDLEAVDDLGMDGDVDHLVDFLAARDSDGAVLCTHGEVLSVLFARLRARGAIHRGDISAEGRVRFQKGATWVLEGPVDGQFYARYLPPPAPRTGGGWLQGSVRAELGRLALEQQRLLGTIAALTTTTQRLAAGLGPQLVALEAERAATLSQLDQMRETARALADAHARLVETQRRVLAGLLPAGSRPAPPARMVAGLTDAGAILTAASSELARRHPERRWAVLAEQPLAVRAEPAQVERLMIALLDAADATLPPAAPTWVIARATAAGAVVAVATDPASLPLSGLRWTAAGRRPQPLPPHQACATPVGQAGQLAELLGGELTIATGGAAPANQLLLRFPLAALPDEVWPDQFPLPATDTTVGASYN